MNIEKRIRHLEETTGDLAYPEMTVSLIVKDGRKTDSPDPDRLALIVKAGTPHGGCTFHRDPDETEQDFIERTKR